MAVRDPLGPPVYRHPLTEAAAASDALRDAQAILGHGFARLDLLREALTHRSAAHGGGRSPHRGGSNERLEFIGDRVLGLLIAEWLAERFPDEQEGELGPRHAHLVSRVVLARIAEAIGLPQALSIAPNEARAGVGRLATVVADGLEAVIGAVYLDGGLEPARRFVRQAWGGSMAAQAATPPKDPKTALQEWALARGQKLPEYRIDNRTGPPHAPVFTISVEVDGRTGSGTAGSKRAAERAAAADLLGQLAP